ncbi:MAG TPA: carboxypeptidase-like regulatory domain-containing protein [Planctomycetota bacterium]|nr:carboxypeptidase-like regulatory domain-containing protein [Planctomycetota bacterium]
MRLGTRIFLLALFAVAGAFLWAQRKEAAEGGGGVAGAPRLPREFPGIVRADGAPVPRAHVRIYEDVPGGYAAEGRAGEDGTFRLSWTPTGSADARALFLAAWDDAGRFAKTIAAADPLGATLDLLPPEDLRGRVVDVLGRPVAGARVAAVVRHSFEEPLLAESGADGQFTMPLRAPRGEPIDLLVRAPGMAACVEPRFRGGDPVTIHLAAARNIALRAIDPKGRPVAGARTRLAVPRALAPAAPSASTGADGRAVLEGASDGSHVPVELEADGFLPVEAPAWPGLVSDVILWPAREVEVVAWDAWNAKGIEGVRFEADPNPVRGEEWWGTEPGATTRRVPVRPGATAGSYLARLPRCPVAVSLTAPGYGDGLGDIPADASRATIRLQPPMSGDKPALLRIRAPGGTPALDLIVADEAGSGFLREATLREGKADVVVPPGMRLQVGSGAAAEGVFLPKHGAPPLRPGESRTLRIGTRPAHRLLVTTDPPVDGEATLVATELARYVEPRRAPVKAGHVEFWVAPFRKFKLRVAPPPGFFAHEAEVETSKEDVDLLLHLEPAAQLRYRIEDAAGSAIPFARVLVYEPGAAGKMALEGAPREAFADALGAVTFPALRAGDGAVEIAAPLFRGHRAIVRLTPGVIEDAGTVRLEPAGTLEGQVVDEEGSPVAGAKVRALFPRISWLPMPGGGTRQLYDLTESSLGDGVTDEQGRFSVPDRSPGPSLVAVYPGVRSLLAPMAFEPGDRLVLRKAAYVELELPSSPDGVYVLLGEGAAVLVKTDPPLRLRPLPLLLPAGRSSLYAKLLDWRWGAKELDLVAGETIRVELSWQR